jgi:hypothetical protein
MHDKNTDDMPDPPEPNNMEPEDYASRKLESGQLLWHYTKDLSRLNGHIGGEIFGPLLGALVLLALFATCNAHADDAPTYPKVRPDARCDAPPYGATPADYDAAQPAFEDVAKAIAIDMAARPGRVFGSTFAHRPDWYMKRVIPIGIRKACYVKLDGSPAARKDYHDAGIDDEQIEALTTATLAIRYFHSLGYPPGPQSDVLCSLHGPDNRPLWSTQSGCAQWAATKDRQERLQQEKQQELLKHAQQQEQREHPGITIIYAIFLCLPTIGQCQMYGAPRVDSFGNAFPEVTFHSLLECQQYVHRLGPISPPVDGRFMLPDGLWYECRRKRVDTEVWEAAQ